MFAGMKTKRLSYEKMKEVCDSLNVVENPYQPYPNDSHWWRTGENDEYAYESNDYTLDYRIIDKSTGKVVWSYYTDFYTG
jgi:hypothetical protein